LASGVSPCVPRRKPSFLQPMSIVPLSVCAAVCSLTAGVEAAPKASTLDDDLAPGSHKPVFGDPRSVGALDLAASILGLCVCAVHPVPAVRGAALRVRDLVFLWLRPGGRAGPLRWAAALLCCCFAGPKGRIRHVYVW
jgi:hypothetical protein